MERRCIFWNEMMRKWVHVQTHATTTIQLHLQEELILQNEAHLHINKVYKQASKPENIRIHTTMTETMWLQFIYTYTVLCTLM